EVLQSRRNAHGEESQKNQEGEKAPLREELRQRRQKRDAPVQEGLCQERARRQGRQGEKPQTGDCHRPLESPQEGQESAKEEIPVLSQSFCPHGTSMRAFFLRARKRRTR